jgi:23S rRNA (uracil1939-C5)-methyltransferase
MSPSCKHFPVCSGCSQDLAASVPAVWQEIKEFCEDKVVPVLEQGPSIHWRCRAKLAVRGTIGNPFIGLFKRNTHDVISIPDCLVHHPKINVAIEFIKKWMVDLQIIPYDELTGKGELRYIQLVVERGTGKVQVSFVINIKENNKSWIHHLECLEKSHPELWHSLWLNFNDKSTNTIFGNNWFKVYGEELIWENFNPIEICYLPATFGQANLDLFEKMLQRINEWIPSHARVTEYFAGVGAIGLYLADKCLEIVCEEANPHAESCFLKAKEKLPQSVQNKLSFCNLPAEESLHLMEKTDCVIPLEKGLQRILDNH